MILTLETNEAEMLKKLLDRCLVDLRGEIHHTDRERFKAELKTEEALLRCVLEKLKVDDQDEIRSAPRQAAKSA